MININKELNESRKENEKLRNKGLPTLTTIPSRTSLMSSDSWATRE